MFKERKIDSQRRHPNGQDPIRKKGKTKTHLENRGEKDNG